MSQHRIYPDGQEQGVPATSEHCLDCSYVGERQGYSKPASTLVAGIHDSGRIGYADDNTECALNKDLY